MVSFQIKGTLSQNVCLTWNSSSSTVTAEGALLGCWGAHQKPIEFSVSDFTGFSALELSPCLILTHILSCSVSFTLHQYHQTPQCTTILIALWELPLERSIISLRKEAGYMLGQPSPAEIVVKLWLFAILWWTISQLLFSFPLQCCTGIKVSSKFSSYHPSPSFMKSPPVLTPLF